MKCILPYWPDVLGAVTWIAAYSPRRISIFSLVPWTPGKGAKDVGPPRLKPAGVSPQSDGAGAGSLPPVSLPTQLTPSLTTLSPSTGCRPYRRYRYRHYR